MCKGYHDPCVVTVNDGGLVRFEGSGSFNLGFGLGDRGVYHIFCFSFFFFAAVGSSFMTVSISLFFFSFQRLWSF